MAKVTFESKASFVSAAPGGATILTTEKLEKKVEDFVKSIVDSFDLPALTVQAGAVESESERQNAIAQAGMLITITSGSAQAHEISIIERAASSSQDLHMPVIELVDISNDRIGKGSSHRVKILFSADSLATIASDLTRAIREARELTFENNVGFKVAESLTEIRFFDWGERTHKEEYKKKLKIHPLRDGDITVQIISGTSDIDSLRRNNISGTHQYKIVDLQDNFHIKTLVSIPDARKDSLERIVEKSLRERVPNRSRDCIQIHIPEFGDGSNYWQVAFHVLYPTQLLWLYVELIDGLRIRSNSVRVFHKVHQQLHEEKDAALKVTGGEGDLQTLTWEKREARPGTDYIILWQWA